MTPRRLVNPTLTPAAGFPDQCQVLVLEGGGCRGIGPSEVVGGLRTMLAQGGLASHTEDQTYIMNAIDTLVTSLQAAQGGHSPSGLTRVP